MRRVAVLCVTALACAGDGRAESLSAGASPCGGDAYSSAQVIEGRPSRRGPITSVPDTLCANLSAPRGSTSIDIYVAPGLSSGVGADGASAPYEGGASRGHGPPGPRRGDY